MIAALSVFFWHLFHYHFPQNLRQIYQKMGSCSLTLTPNHTYRFSSVLGFSLFSAPPLDLRLRVPLLSLSSLSHSRSAAIEIANQLFDLRKLISSEFVMSYSPRRAEEAVGLTDWAGRGRGGRRDRPSEREAFARADQENENCCRPPRHLSPRRSFGVVHPGGRFRGR